jgi:hypothetical protein
MSTSKQPNWATVIRDANRPPRAGRGRLAFNRIPRRF